LNNRSTVRELDNSRALYGYDLANQLDAEEREGSNAFQNDYLYDRVGNRTRKTDVVTGGRTTYSYNAANELTLTVEPGDIRTTFAYDRNGNTLSEDRLGQVTQYTWDYENRLIGQVEPDGTRYTYTYRGNDSRRVKNEAPDGNTRILVWDELNCFQELDGGLNLIAQYTDYPGQWGGLASQRRGAYSSYYGFDLQWTGRVLVAQNQAISDTFTNDAWGVKLSATGGTVNVHRYKGLWGYRSDTMTSINVWHRQLNTNLGIWNSVDPARSKQQFGTVPLPSYSYTGNNPVTNADPNGLGLPPVVVIVVGVGACVLAFCGGCAATSGAFDDAIALRRNWCSNKVACNDTNHGNAYQHCVGSCLLAKRCSSVCSAIGGIAYEIKTFIQDTLQDRTMDHHNNQIGIGCASSYSCAKCCDTAYRSGKLYWYATPPATGLVNIFGKTL
jgi:RHS repeat-associated protein